MITSAVIFLVCACIGIVLLYLDDKGDISHDRKPITLSRIVSVLLVSAGVSIWFW